MDCSAQSPKSRVSFCYDRAALAARKEHKPKNCVLDAAADMGVEVLTEEEYFALQKLGEFDTKSSSWLKTPPEIRELGGAIYADRRYNRDLHRSQRRRVLLWRQRVPWLVKV